MKNALVPERSVAMAAAILAAALLAGAVIGREDERTPALPRPATTVARDLSAPVGVDLDPRKLERRRSGEQVVDVFVPREKAMPLPPASVAPVPPAVPPAPDPPPAATAPPVPFTYLGKMTRGDQVIVYLLKDQEMVLAGPGMTLEGAYRLDGVSDTAVRFVYLPLGTRQLLDIERSP